MRRAPRITIAAVALLCLSGCSNPRVLTPCAEARELRARADAAADSYERSILKAKADAAQQRCRDQANDNAQRNYEAEKRRHRDKAAGLDR